jgi:hypothetical protein
MLDQIQTSGPQEDIQINDTPVITGMLSLIRETRRRARGNVNQLVNSPDIHFSKSHIYRFLSGHGVCFVLINALANHYGIRYQIGNFREEDLPEEEWITKPLS